MVCWILERWIPKAANLTNAKGHQAPEETEKTFMSIEITM